MMDNEKINSAINALKQAEDARTDTEDLANHFTVHARLRELWMTEERLSAKFSLSKSSRALPLTSVVKTILVILKLEGKDFLTEADEFKAPKTTLAAFLLKPETQTEIHLELLDLCHSYWIPCFGRKKAAQLYTMHTYSKVFWQHFEKLKKLFWSALVFFGITSIRDAWKNIKNG